jgi:hypothetical protein
LLLGLDGRDRYPVRWTSDLGLANARGRAGHTQYSEGSRASRMQMVEV